MGLEELKKVLEERLEEQKKETGSTRAMKDYYDGVVSGLEYAIAMVNITIKYPKH